MEKFLNEQDDLFGRNPVKFNQQFDELYESDSSEVFLLLVSFTAHVLSLQWSLPHQRG